MEEAHRDLRVLQIGMSWLPEQAGNGLDRVFHALIQHLPDTGISVRGLVAGSENVAHSSGRLVEAFASDRAPLRLRLRGIRRALRRILAVTEFDIAASHFALYTLAVLDVLKDKPLVIHFHGPWALEGMAEGQSRLYGKAKEILERCVYRRGVRYIVLSDAFRDVLHETYGISQDYIRRIPGGVDTNRFDTAVSRAEARHYLGWPSGRPTVLSVRRLAHRMGLENLLKAVSIAREQVPDVLVYIAGQGPLAQKLTHQIAGLNLHEHVKLLGYVPEDHLPLAYRAADLSIVPSVSLEGFGLITVESLAAGTPPLVTPIGGLPEVVRGLSSDLIFDNCEPATLGRHLALALLGDLDLPTEQACRDYAKSHFDWQVIARRTRSVYDEALS